LLLLLLSKDSKIPLFRFNSEAPKLLLETDKKKLTETLGDYLDRNGYSQAFRDNYLLPMTGEIPFLLLSHSFKILLITFKPSGNLVHPNV